MAPIKYHWEQIDPLLGALPRNLSWGDLQRLSVQTGCPAATLSRRLAQLRDQGRAAAVSSGWSWREEEDVLRLTRQGRSTAEIAAHLARTPDAVAVIQRKFAQQKDASP